MNSYQKLKIKYDALLEENALLKKNDNSPNNNEVLSLKREIKELKEKNDKLYKEIEYFENNFISVDLLNDNVEEDLTKFDKLVEYIKKEKRNNIYLGNILNFIEKIG